MGAQQTCQLDETDDVCQMSKCVIKIKGRASNSGSPTDTWMCKLQRGTTFRGESYKRMFLKFGIAPRPFLSRRHQHDIDFLFAKQSSLGLQFEIRVYDRIISPLLNGICPNFVRSLLVSHNCTYDDLLTTLTRGLDVHLSKKAVMNRLNRSIYYMTHAEPERPAVHVDPTMDYPEPDPEFRYMVLTTQHDDVVTYHEWLKTKTTEADLNTVSLQLFIALHAMAQCKLMHNDLHGDNIFIQTLEEPRHMQYEIDGVQIAFLTRLLVLVYDFDRATCPSLGENLFVTQPLTRARGEDTIYRKLQPFEPNRDLASLCKWLHLANQWYASGLDAFVTLRLRDRVPWYQAYGSEVETSLSDSIGIVTQIMRTEQWQPLAHTYVISHYMFNPDGSFNTGHERLAQMQQALRQYTNLSHTYLTGLQNCEQFAAKAQADLQACQAQLLAANEEVERLRSTIMFLQRPQMDDSSEFEE
jgi:hypothetical protein